MEKVERPWGWYINVKETPNQFIIRIDPVGSILIILELLLLRIRSSSQNKTHLRVSQQTSVPSNALLPQRTLGHRQGPSQSPSRKRRSIIAHIILSVYIPKECLHRIENVGNENVEFVETQIGDYLEEDDIVRYEDDFGRL